MQRTLGAPTCIGIESARVEPARGPSRPAVTAKIWLGNLLVALAFGGLLATANIGQADLDFPLNALVAAAAAIATTSVGLFGRSLAMTGRKQRAAQTAESTANDPRPPVVYLRSFADDQLLENANIVRGFIQLTTEEEQYARVLNRIGPFIAVGDPREGLPDLGATRVYVGAGDWHQRVEALLNGARLIVLRLSATEGLLWELRTVIARNDPSKLLLLVPGPPEQYPLLRQRANEWLPKPLPSSVPRTKSFGRLSTVVALVRFGADWNPEFLPIRVNYLRGSLYAPLAPHLQLTLRPLFAQLGAPWKKPRLSIFALVMVAMFVAVLVLFVALAIRDFHLLE